MTSQLCWNASTPDCSDSPTARATAANTQEETAVNENEVKEYIWSGVRDMLDGFLAGEPRDQYIHEDCTIWDSDETELSLGLAGLNAIRARRPAPADRPKVTEIESLNPVIDVYGDFAVCRHWLVVHFADGRKPEHIRNTGVWRKFPQGWQLIHNHEDDVTAKF